jgi:hypothetical protein
MTSLLRPLVAVIAGSVLATSLFAQAPQIEFPASSPAATIKQRVGLTDIEINYSRPSMRGREIFGRLEPYGAVWRTGANNATKITFNTPVKFNGTEVAAGTYALFTIPERAGDWTIIINKVPGQWLWGSYAYDAKNDVARVKATPVPLAQPVETFAIGFNDLASGNSATLNLMWENVRVPVKLEVDVAGILAPKLEAIMASAEPKKPYFSAAMFYYESNLDLTKALEWMNAAIAGTPTPQMWMVYRKGLILAKMGDKAGATAAAQQSLDIIKNDTQSPASLKDEYTRLNNALIASLK